MRDSYDFSEGVKNPYTQKLKQQVTIRLDSSTVQYFKDLATETGIRYQQLINLYLADCAANHLKPHLEWQKN